MAPGEKTVARSAEGSTLEGRNPRRAIKGLPGPEELRPGNKALKRTPHDGGPSAANYKRAGARKLEPIRSRASFERGISTTRLGGMTFEQASAARHRPSAELDDGSLRVNVELPVRRRSQARQIKNLTRAIAEDRNPRGDRRCRLARRALARERTFRESELGNARSEHGVVLPDNLDRSGRNAEGLTAPVIVFPEPPGNRPTSNEE